METLLTMTNLTKKYQNKTILNQVHLTVKKGDSIVFIGNNGMGKSTLLKIIAGLTRPTAGSISYAKKLSSQYIPEHFPKKNFTIEQYIQLMGKIDGCSAEEITEKANKLYQEFHLESMLNTPLKYLSKGSLQKVNVIQALLTPPDILLLDEPLSGQDATSQKVFINKILTLLKQEVTVIMSCHEPQLIAAISETIYEIDKGQLNKKTVKEAIAQPIYSITFYASKQNELPVICKNYQKIEKNTKIIFTVPEDESDAFILSMLENNWSLRKMEVQNAF